MIWVGVILLAGVGAILLLFWPRLTITAAFGSSRASLDLSSIWLQYGFDFKSGATDGRVFFFRLGRAAPPHIRAADQPSVQNRETHRPASSQDRKTAKAEFWRGDRDLRLKIIRRGVHLIIRLVRSFSIVRLHAHLTIASPDPMTTGIIYGALCPLLTLNQLPRVELGLEADFIRTHPQADMLASLSVRPLRLVAEVLIALMGMPWWSIIRALHRQRRQRMATAVAPAR